MIRLSYSERHPIPLPAGHKFPIEKYKLVREQLEYQGLIKREQLFAPSRMTRNGGRAPRRMHSMIASIDA
jgi:acetoin utilization deacetylase AcuC-like enzyme